jgi:uncharacterized membrane protein YfhO
VADAAYPGWTARVDGQPAPLLTANLMLRGVALPAGAHEITLEYRPASWQLGRLVSLMALASCFVLLALTVYPKTGPSDAGTVLG